MKTLKKKTMLMLIITILLSILIPTQVRAAGNFSLSKSSASLTTGGTTTITITASGCAGQFSISSSNSSVATVSTSSAWLDNSSTTVTITAKSAGSATITVTPTDVTDTELNEVTGSKSCSITVSNPAPVQTTPTPSTTTPSTTKPSTNSSSNSSSNNKPITTTPSKSSNSKLDSLEVAEGTISPEFSSGTKEYTISVPNETTKLSISAVADSSKSTVKITGNEELKEGQNTINITVTAEDGSTTTYTIVATRARKELNLQALSIFYINEKGEKTPIELNPVFAAGVYEYTLTDISHNVDKIEVEAVASRETANIEIAGNEGLVEGENVITIKVLEKSETGLEEQKTYTLKVNKEQKPVVAPLTPMEKMQNWFTGVGNTIHSFVTKNAQKIIASVLLIEAVALIGLTVYFVHDYKSYKKMLMKLAELNKANLMEKANVAIEQNSEKDIIKTENIKNQEDEEVQQASRGKGKRFKE